MKFVCSIQLCKLLIDNDSQKLNFPRFLRRLEADFRIKENKSGNFKSLKEKYFYENMKDIKDNIPSLVILTREKIDSKLELIQKLKDVRDKIYAHTDPSSKDKYISWQEVYDLSILAVDVYNTLNEKLTFTTLYLEMLEPWSPKWILRDLLKLEIVGDLHLPQRSLLPFSFEVPWTRGGICNYPHLGVAYCLSTLRFH
ncbi:hypothetical protein [Algoriphagus terrigena]|uniref:AbiU2 domain-containing protein n=1 Tax=Algoriphagus terrigena TaxID=344884 RepID=UPI00047A80B0|nr:hypothetical protein [Algoriphagus terrigena]